MDQHEVNSLPRVLIIDDLYGRKLSSGVNPDREHLCGRFLLRDVTGDESPVSHRGQVRQPIAEAVFYRGQKPERASVGDHVENDLEGCVDKVREGWDSHAAWQWSMVLLDMCFYTGQVTKESDRDNRGMPEGHHDDDQPERYFGLTILRALRQHFPDLPVVIFSSKPRGDVSYLIDKEGAKAFLERDAQNGPEQLRGFLLKYALAPDPSGTIIGRSFALLKVLRDARLAVVNEEAENQNFLILGETGVGKEGLARFLHDQSIKRRHKPFLPVNCPALQPTLASTLLFGVEKGVATDVIKRTGLFQQADGGSLFLDEIADLPREVMPGILRVLQSREVLPEGAEAKNVKRLDLQLIAATNADLGSMTKHGEFREDLYFRLASAGCFTLPPLRERREDIPSLAEHFFRRAEQRLPGAGHRRKITPDAIEALQAYSWPGNIRELESVVYRAMKQNPDAEYLHPVHFELPESAVLVPRERSTPGDVRPQPETPTDPARPPSLIAASEDNALMVLKSVFENTNVEGLDYAALNGSFPVLQEAYAGFLWHYLCVALERSKKPPTPQQPEGTYSYQRLGRLLSGDQELGGTEARRLLKRILKTDPKTEELAKQHKFFSDFVK